MMRALVLARPGEPLQMRQVEKPVPKSGEILIRVHMCAVCRTDLHVVDGDLKEPKLPIIPGHEIIGIVEAVGTAATKFSVGDRVGVPWLGWTCGTCSFCRSGRENLCDAALFTGYTIDGGFAEYVAADERFAFALPSAFSDEKAAPMMCAGLIGYRSLKATGSAQRLGLYGFGAAAHIIAQVALHQGREVYAFTKPDDQETQDFALALGCQWAGGSDQAPPVPLDAAVLFAPVGDLVPLALKAVNKGGIVVCAGIHMSDIPSFPYNILWQERTLTSVANLTREDGVAFLALAPEVGIDITTRIYPMSQANQALDDLRHGRFDGAAVLDLTI